MLDSALADKYPFLNTYTSPVKRAEREIVGRKEEMRSVLAAFMRPELCNVILLGEAGSGKTMLVQGTMIRDSNRIYLEVDLAKMIADLNDPNEMAAKLKQLFDETADFGKNEGKELVLFIDEFHQIVQLSPAAVEALKPLLADSGTRGIRVIAATTYIEFRKFIAPNQPLVERLQRINLNQPDKEMTVEILKGMAKRYGVMSSFYNNHIFEMIYEYTNRYIPANSQPRKSILILDAMVGWHRSEGRPMDLKLLADVIYESEGVNVAFRVDATNIKKELDKHVLSQHFATSVIEERLQICVADLNNKSKPMSSFLFTGSTGTGKSTTCSTLIPVYAKDASISHKLAGDVEVGDYVFDRNGCPTKVLGVFPQGKRDVYRVTLDDGRTLDVSDNHLWAVCPSENIEGEGYTIYTTKTLIDKGFETKSFIPMNGAVEWPACDYVIDPYVIGVSIGNGFLTSEDAYIVSCDDEFVINKISGLICAGSYDKISCCFEQRVKYDSDYLWYFYTNKTNVQLKDICGNLPEMYQKPLNERRMPRAYMTGSVDQRWSLIQGLFDTNGSIQFENGEDCNLTYSTCSKDLAYDVQELLYSLGVSSEVNVCHREHCEHGQTCFVDEYVLYVRSRNADKCKYFSSPCKLEALKSVCDVSEQCKKFFDCVGIRSIEKLDYQDEMVCFYVDNDEHLYQAGQYIVTHNTETTKQLARILFNDERRLIRFDMTEYANADSLERFREELTARVWERPYSIVLLDEIEKACAPVTRLLLQVLDDGRLMDENNREVSFSNAYIVITTNAGSEIYKTIAQYNVDDTGSGKQMKKYNKLIRASISATTGANKFPPELLGRIDMIVPFQPLSEATQKEIVKMKLRKLIDEVQAKHNVELRISGKVVDYLVEDNLDTDSNAGGARAVMSKLESEVTTAVARYINSHPNSRKIGVGVEGQMASDNKNQLESEAYIRVSSLRK